MNRSHRQHQSDSPIEHRGVPEENVVKVVDVEPIGGNVEENDDAEKGEAVEHRPHMHRGEHEVLVQVSGEPLHPGDGIDIDIDIDINIDIDIDIVIDIDLRKEFVQSLWQNLKANHMFLGK